MRRLLIIFCFIYCPSCLSQNWQPLGNGLDFAARVLYADSVENKLFIGGEFVNANNSRVKHIATWDGLQWDSLNSDIGSAVISITRYLGQIYAGGYFRYSNNYSTFTNGFAKWSGSNWEPVFPDSNPHLPVFFFLYDSLMYISGSFDTIGGVYSPFLTAWNGSNFIPVGVPGSETEGGFANGVTYFQDKLYLAGNFADSTYNIYYFASRDSMGNWTQLCSPVACSQYYTIATYQNEVYLSGIFSVPPNQFIVRFDGINYNNVGLGVNDLVFKLKVINGYLFAAGRFTMAGGIPASKVAFWDGNSWHPFSTDTIDGDVLDIELFNNEFYIAGNFNSINGTPVGKIAKYSNTLFSNKLVYKDNVEIYPNPVFDYLKVNFSDSEFRHLRVYDYFGRQVFYKFLIATETELNVSILNPGIYFLVLEGKFGRVVKKLVRQ